MKLASLGPVDTIGQGVSSSMWYAIKLDSSIDCKKICTSIQKNLFEKFLKENIPLEGKILYMEIKDPVDSPAPIESLEHKKPNIIES